MAAINTLIWQVAFILLLVKVGLDSSAWFVGGMATMLWLIVAVFRLARMEEQADEEA